MRFGGYGSCFREGTRLCKESARAIMIPWAIDRETLKVGGYFSELVASVSCAFPQYM